MNKRGTQIDLMKIVLYLLKKCWIIILCAAIGFGFMYWRSSSNLQDTYTASGTMYVYNLNPNLINYGYSSAADLNSAVRLMDIYLVVIKSNKVMDVVVERLLPDYPDITAGYISSTLYMGSVSETGVMRVSCRTDDPQKSADICNAVMDVAPAEIVRVVNAGYIEIIDYATPPLWPDGHSIMSTAMMGGLAGAAVSGGLLLLLFLLNQKIEDAEELNESYTLPVLASLKRTKKEESMDPSRFLLSGESKMEVIESYSKLRMNLLYTLVGKDKHAVAVTSGISGEGKSTIAANLAISVAMSRKKVILVDADMRRGCQHEIFKYDDQAPGLSNVLAGEASWKDVLIKADQENMEIMPAGRIPPNPAELLDSPAMHRLLDELEAAYDLILLDAPPINIVSDPLALSSGTAGAIFVVRQHFSDHREVKKALIQAEMTGLNMLGFVFYGENLKRSGYYSRKYYYKGYQQYYGTENRYDTRKRENQETAASKE